MSVGVIEDETEYQEVSFKEVKAENFLKDMKPQMQ